MPSASATVRRRPVVATVRSRLARTGIASPTLALLIVAHLAFGLLRLPSGAIVKRAQLLTDFAEQGPLWHFRKADAHTQQVAAWLIAAVEPQHAVLFDGSEQGQLQLLAPALFPALLVHAGALQPDGTAAGRPVFDGRAPWLDAAPTGLPVVVGSLGTLRIEYR